MRERAQQVGGTLRIDRARDGGTIVEAVVPEPMRPAGPEGWSEDKLALLVTRDSMIGTGLPKMPSEVS